MFLASPPLPHSQTLLEWAKVQFTEGRISLGHFWYINFHFGGGGSGPLPPLRSKSRKNQGSANLFSFGPIFFSRTFGAPLAEFFGHSTLSLFPFVADIMSQRPISRSFGTPVQLCPYAKRDDIKTAILYFHFQDRCSGKKRQEARNAAEKVCCTFFLNTPMALLEHAHYCL